MVKLAIFLAIFVVTFVMGWHCVDNAWNCKIEEAAVLKLLQKEWIANDSTLLGVIDADTLYGWGVVLMFTGLTGSATTAYYLAKKEKHEN